MKFIKWSLFVSKILNEQFWSLKFKKLVLLIILIPVVSLIAYLVNEKMMWQFLDDVATTFILKNLHHYCHIKTAKTHDQQIPKPVWNGSSQFKIPLERSIAMDMCLKKGTLWVYTVYIVPEKLPKILGIHITK